ncbi:hypothetical protein [Mycolicibacterium bacteremicum]|uniref:Uncharacterized protein n=1 Tax=Mycolicibacterium bacteremicum TaxID=564198 RepID=A0A1W9YPC5_MYCBA|nr:hypothetical protein [Mycolicibacterium bacteremicum]MCV7435572.1 hypothetical protein [Mycolicibacterium bacteremicum]ORA01847.1 hypothetical protein BST17_26275 [Mycolicibacterium bacteremicum]
MGYQDDPIGYERRLRAKLQPDVIRGTLAFAGLYQITHEMIQQAVLERVREFYCCGLEPGAPMTDRERQRYQHEVLSLAPKKRFRASLLWLVNSGAITQSQADRLNLIYAHRHSLTHELVRYLVDPEADPDVELFVDALTILKDLHRFWIDIELSTGGFFLADGSHVDDVDAEAVMPLSLMVLQQCVDAYVEGFESLGSDDAEMSS